MIKKDLIAKIVGILVIVISLGGGWWWIGIKSFGDTSLDLGHEPVLFSIAKGNGLIHVANQLQSVGIINDARKFIWLARIRGQSRQIKAGEYELESGTTPNLILDLFISGKVKQYSLTLVEGWSYKQMMEAVNAHTKLSHKLDGLGPDEVMMRIGYSGIHPEGRFLPDTYHFPVNTSDIDFLKRAYEAMEKTLMDEWEKRQSDLPYESAYQALVMASIVEKETSVPSERQMIAGVFVRRLKKRMRLQTDPTVIYGMGDEYQGNIRKRDLRRDTPYNTYTRRGLPPTPIAMPGRDAIHAALQPADGDFLYFVAKGDGSHYFSSTMLEHNKAVRKYQIKRRKNDYRSTPTKE